MKLAVEKSRVWRQKTGESLNRGKSAYKGVWEKSFNDVRGRNRGDDAIKRREELRERKNEENGPPRRQFVRN